MEKGGVQIDAGSVEFAMSYRTEIMDDQGLCVQVYSKIDGADTEILRFDCFDQAPHYHYGPENHNVRLFMDKTTAGNPLGWTLKNLRGNLPAMVRRAGYEDLAASLEKTPVSAAVLDSVETKAREMVRAERRTVHHKMPEMIEGDMIVAGNIRFGLEYRHLPQVNDEGMAIHVLSDVAGQEVELLAFDCFQNGPHYHYGPRNQDVRIYWDVTTSGETLKWTLDQFKGGKLRSMIERAGYPSIASELDENLLQATLPKIEARSWELVALNNK
ncbi:MAG: hypothetical protein O3A93_12880 [Chloroflexi bacterium]|nr:hypothetical protein [Chloroflexota bacterium]MDA1272130.1 hypothetical protein [Chloroflexota bacterium]PKB58397.1 MAG: hypothetical protein BZY83_07230 [SAR202 cluster bacterium Casp-Chloro-G2]